jgi:PTS system mannose-specific IIC component
MTVVDLLPLVMLGAVLGLDVVSFPQMMISRPIVAATLAGALLGEPGRGLIVGVLLECFALETLPVGASRYPEWASASVVAGALLATAPSAGPGVLTLAVLMGLVVAWGGGWSMVQVRRVNAHLAAQRHDAVARGSRRVVEGLQIWGLSLDLLRGATLTLASLLLATPAMHRLLALWSVSDRLSRAVVVGLAASVAAAAVWKLFHAVAGARWWMFGGILAGLLLMAVQ